MSGYLDFDCKNCGRHRVETNGICEKCNYDNIHNEFAQPILECLEHGAGTCRNENLIDELRAELARRDEIIVRLKEDGERLAQELVDDAYPYPEPDCVICHRALMKEVE